jgi:hypothetical protein
MYLISAQDDYRVHKYKKKNLRYKKIGTYQGYRIVVEEKRKGCRYSCEGGSSLVFQKHIRQTAKRFAHFFFFFHHFFGVSTRVHHMSTICLSHVHHMSTIKTTKYINIRHIFYIKPNLAREILFSYWGYCKNSTPHCKKNAKRWTQQVF